MLTGGDTGEEVQDKGRKEEERGSGEYNINGGSAGPNSQTQVSGLVDT